LSRQSAPTFVQSQCNDTIDEVITRWHGGEHAV
jgi:hypothetical protein